MTTASALLGRGTLLFLAIAFGWSWLIAGVIWRAGWMNPASPSPLAALGLTAFMFGPAIAAVVCAWTRDRGRRFAALGLRAPFNVWLIWAWLAPIVICAAALALTLLLSGRDYQPYSVVLEQSLQASGQDLASIPMSIEAMAWIGIASSVTLGAAINWPILLSEELGWRGWLWDRWSGLGFWRNVLATGFVWGLWHAPIIALGHNYPGQPVSGPVLMIGLTILLSPALHLVRARGGSVWHAALFHGTFNAAGGLTIVMLTYAAMPWRGIVGIGGFIALALASAVVFALQALSPARQERSSPEPGAE